MTSIMPPGSEADERGPWPAAPHVPPRGTVCEALPYDEPLPPANDGSVAWAGRGSVLLLLLKNLGLNIVTLSFYRFWGRTRLRRFLWANISVLGDSLVYTGTGMEMFKGFLIALCLLVPLGVASAATEFIPDDTAQLLAKLLFGATVVFLVFMAFFLARRYRLSRTTWRGVRCGQTGHAADYAWRKIGWTLLTILSLGFAHPWLAMREQRFLMERSLFGDRAFAFDGKGRDLFLSWLLVYVTLGTGWLWFRVKKFRYTAEHTTLGDVRFSSGARALPIYMRVLLLMVAGWATIAIFGFVVLFGLMGAVESGTLNMPEAEFQIGGLLGAIPVILVGPLLVWPLLYIPVLRQFCETFSIRNPEALDVIAQSVEPGPATGEGLADAFDVGLT